MLAKPEPSGRPSQRSSCSGMRPRAPRPAPPGVRAPRPTARRSRPAGGAGGGADCASSTSSSRGRPSSQPAEMSSTGASTRSITCSPVWPSCRRSRLSAVSPNTSAASCGDATACRAIAPAAAASPGSASRMSASAESWPPTNSTSRSPNERLTWNGSPPTSSPPRQATCTVRSPSAVEPPPLGQPGVQHERAGPGHRPDHGIPLAADRLEILDPPERPDGQSGSLPGRGLLAHGRFASHMVQYTGEPRKRDPGDGSRLTGCRGANTLAPGSLAGTDVGGFRVKVARVARSVRRFGALGVVVVLGAAVLVGSAVASADIRQARPGAAAADRDRDAAGGRPDLHRHLRPARPRAVPLQLGDQEPGRRHGPVQGSDDRRRDAGRLAGRQPDHDARPEPRADRRRHREPDRPHGAYFIFNPSQGHNHWHFQQAPSTSCCCPVA